MSLASPFASAPVATATQLAVDASSRTEFRRLGRDAAISLARRDFHVARPSWTTPGSEQGGHVLKYLGSSAIAEKLPGGQHVVVSSSTPDVTANAAGAPTPVSLTLRETSEGYLPQNPLVPIVISKRPQDGIALPEGIRVTPASAGTAEAPTVVGTSVIATNASPSTDLIEQPLPTGAGISWQLRSQESSPENTLRFHLRRGETLRMSTTIPGGAEVTEGGKQLLVVPPANASDAGGRSLSTSFSISGANLTTHVDLSGPVDYPVLVDPNLTFAGYYGTENGSKSWAGWQSQLSSGFELIDESNFLEARSHSGEPFNDYGLLYIYAPGEQGKTGSAGVTRVDLTEMLHSTAESILYATIQGSNGSPIYTFNGSEKGSEHNAPLETTAGYSNQPIAFCAEWAGGYDGDPTGESLCDEHNDQGAYFEIEDDIDVTTSSNYNEVGMGGARVTYRDAFAPNSVKLNDNGYIGEWLKAPPTGWKISAEDEGLGVQEFALEVPAGNGHYFSEASSCDTANGFTGCPSSATSAAINLSGLTETKRWELQPIAVDAAGNTNAKAENRVNLYVDKTPPVIGEFTGTLGQAANHVIGNGNYTLDYSAEDGSPANPQSGVKEIEVKVDGKLVPGATTYSACAAPKGPPSEGCYALSGSWIMNGQTYGTGVHAITVVARDWAGNESEKSFNVTVNEAAYEPVGPGAVNLQTGDFKLSASDVEVSGGAASLSVSRTYDSRNLTQGANGPLGPQWALVLPDAAAGSEWSSLELLNDGSVAVYGGHGNEITFTPKSGGYNSPIGYPNETLTENSPAEYQITDADGDYTTFKQVEGTGPFVPSGAAQATAAGGLNKVHYTFTKTSEGIAEPTEMLGPEPSEGACTSKLVQGCRALTFKYANSTGATGEGPTEWGEYKGRLSQVLFTAWEPAKGEMSAPIVVAQYAYDTKGRLRAEWDPRISNPLKITYGYDAENHVTAVSPPGQEPWLLHYGAIASDASTGRLLSASRFNAETGLWKGEALTNSALPKLSSSKPVVATQLSVTTGTWSTTAVVYGYQWERCNGAGEYCVPIAGATNQTYTPIAEDRGHALAVKVTATNAAGSVTAVSVASSEVTAPVTFSFAFGSAGSGAGQMKEPTAVAVGGSGESTDLWVADAVNHRVDEFNATTKAFIQAFGWGVSNGKEELQTCTSSCKAGISGDGTGQFANPEGIAISPGGTIIVADSADDRVQEFSSPTSLLRSYGSYGSEKGEFSEPHGIAVESSDTVWVADTQNCRVEEFEAGKYVRSIGKCGSKAGEFEGTMGVAVQGGNVFVTDYGHGTVQEFNGGGQWVREFGSSGTEPGEFTDPWAIATWGQGGDVYVSSYGDGRVEAFTPEGKFVEEFGHSGSEREDFDGPSGLAINQTTGTIYVADEYNNRVDTWSPAYLAQEPVQPAPNPGSTAATTIDYQVPVSGAGAPYALGKTEAEAWGEKDHPVEATAIFPAREPQGWPAGEYTHADVFYMDSANRTVNTASPGGSIATAQYSEANDNVERSLTADNRAKIVAEKLESTSNLWYTENTYNSEGTELTSTLGPQHNVKLASGSEAAERQHTRYYYDESAPGGATYHVVTKTIESAYHAGTDTEERTITNSYSGQENLGWKLHSPTSTTTSIGHVTFTTTESYEPSTGETKETHTPVGSAGDQATYISQTGSAGSGNGQFSEPTGIARDSKGNLWVADQGHDRIEEFNEKGEYVKQFGKEGSNNGQLKCKGSGKPVSPTCTIAIDTKGNLWVTDPGNHRVQVFNEQGEYVKKFGSEGTNGGQFKTVGGIAIDAHGNAWVVDSEDYRVEEFNEKGEYVKSFGTKGTGAGQFEDPVLIAVDAHNNLWVTDYSNNRVEVFNEKGEYAKQFGKEGINNGEFRGPTAITIDAYGDVWVADSGNGRVQEFNEAGEFLSFFGGQGIGAGEFKGVGLLTTGGKHELWLTDVGDNRVAKWLTPPTAAGNANAHGSQVIYYTAEPNSNYPGCGKHPEWAALPCQEQAAAQPESGLPKLPETTYTYNIWDEPLTTTDTVPNSEKTTRTTTLTYDAAGRPTTSAITSTVGKTVPTVTDEYNGETGLLVKRSTSSGSITSEYNKLGQLTGYTDANGDLTKYVYEKEKEARLTEVVDGEGSAAASTQTYGYAATTGFLASLKDSAAGTFTASYDLEGHLTTEGYPNGMNANYTYNEAGQPTALEYVKTTHCTTGCTWYTDSVVPSIRGQWATQTSTLGKDSYSYDSLNRLTEAQETPTSKGCTTRMYAYDEAGNRTSLTTREPGSEGKCVTEGGASQSFAYDTANRLDESGVSYDAFGDTTTLPAADAGASTLTNTYYVDNALATQEQNGVKIGYSRDPGGRVSEAITGTETVTSHYEGPGNTPAWTITGSGSWTRNIDGPQGGLAAIQTNGKTPVLQLADLHGDIIATAADSETESKFTAANETNEYGVPRTTVSEKYTWLGADGLATELPTGIISMGARTYVPQIGRFLQTDPQPGGSANSYAYTDDDPVNSSDPSGEYTTTTTYNFEDAAGGSAAAGLPEVYARPGSIEPPEVNLQIEAAANANPPWTAASYFEDGGEEGASLVATAASSGCPTCYEHKDPGKNQLAEAWGWVKSNAKKLVATATMAVTTAVIAGITIYITGECATSAALSGQLEAEFTCYKIAAFGYTLSMAAAISTVDAWKLTKTK